MALIACGFNHKTAPLAIREQVVFSPENATQMLADLLRQGAANEAMILSTCNRTEFYTHVDHPRQFSDWLAAHPRIADIAYSQHWYTHYDQQAVKHMMRVAAGLDSMVLGEPQILGQMKQSFAMASEMGAVGTQLQRLLQRVFSVTKQVRSNVAIGESPVSVAYAAVNIAKRIFADLSKTNVLLIGAGQTVELAGLHLFESGVKQLAIANRSLDKAQKLAEQFYGNAITIADIPLYLKQADIVVSATASTLPILGKGMIESALKSGKRRPLLMLDMAVPRDIEPEAAELEDVYLYNIDHLRDMTVENMKSRKQAALLAEEMIETQAHYFMRQLQSLDAVDTICAYRKKLDALRDREISNALAALKRGEAPEVVLREMGRVLTNKIMHVPTVEMRKAAFDGQTEVLLLAKQLLGL
ncbi:MAG: hemA [Gammaproteobacteria bacterium]|jgi:glutamyl-tRNA reductase|nr:hemA [Gammaproteobacteria bacterium]